MARTESSTKALPVERQVLARHGIEAAGDREHGADQDDAEDSSPVAVEQGGWRR